MIIMSQKKYTKVAYNACFGGFGLSEQAVLRLADLKGMEIYVKKRDFGNSYYKDPSYDAESLVNFDSIERTDPDLIRVIEELGEEASGMFANLKIAEVQSGTLYKIDEYDGRESVMTVDDYYWSRA
jgi:hypothetical protein